VCSDESEDTVDRRDTFAGDFLIEELGFFVIDGRCRQRYEKPTVTAGCKFYPAKLCISDDGQEPALRWAYMSSIISSVLLRRHPRNSGGGQQDG